MNIGLQLLIGFSPLIICSVFFFILKKKCVIPILSVLLVTVAVICGFVFNSVNTESEDTAKIKSDSEMVLYMIYEDILEGDYDSAKSMITEAYSEFGDSFCLSMCDARLRFLTNDYDSAAVLYSKAADLGVSEKKSILSNESSVYEKINSGAIVDPYTAASDASLHAYLTSVGKNPADYGLTSAMSQADAQREYDSAKKYILENIKSDAEEFASKNEKLSTNLKKAVDAASVIDTEYELYNGKIYYSEENLNTAFKSLKKIFEDTPDVFSLDFIDEAFVRGATMQKSYKLLAQYADKTDSQSALATLTVLYLNKNIGKGIFPENFVVGTREQYDSVYDRSDMILEKMKSDGDYDKKVLDECEKIVASIKNRKNNRILAELDNRITPEKVSIDKQSKIYMQLFNLNSTLGEETKADENFKNALDTSVYSDDAGYSEPMKEIIKIVNENTDSQEIVNSGKYFEDAYQNSYPVKPNEEIVVNENLKNEATEYINAKLSMINIGKVDTSAFPVVSADVQFGADFSPKKITVHDANIAISDFTLEKKTYNEAKVFLVCDISGSMSGSENDLQESVSKFIESMTDKETVAIMGFSDHVVFSSGFMTKGSDFSSYISQLRTSGGTNIGHAAYESIAAFNNSRDSFNVIILMTDGEDSSFNSESSLVELKQKCEENNIVLYTIGLGSSVNVNYLKNIAEYGNGSYMQCDDASVSLESRYAFIHSQIERNYKLTFTAIDTVTNKRVLKITNVEDNSQGKRTYKLDYSKSDVDSDDVFVDYSGDSVVNGTDVHVIYKNKNSTPVLNILGENLKKVKQITVSLSDSATYTAEAKLVDDGHVAITLPTDIILGKYDIIVYLDGQEYILNDAIEIKDGSMRKSVSFGAYNFVASNISSSANKTVLSGNVVLNDFIRFKGDVTLVGKLDGYSIEIVDDTGSYVTFNSPLKGLMKVLFSDTMNLPPMKNLTLYNDQINMGNFDEYKVDGWKCIPIVYTCVTYQSPTLSVYPHKIDVSFVDVSLELPLQKEVLKYNGLSPISGKCSAGALITPDTIGFYADVAADIEDTAYISVIPVYLKEFEAKVDTIKHDYHIMLSIGSKKIFKLDSGDDSAFGFSLDIKSGYWDGMELFLDIPVNLCATPPISISDFKIGVSNLSANAQDRNFGERLINATFKGSLDISLCKLADMVPSLKPIFGDVSVITLDDTGITLDFSDFMMQVSSTVKLFGVLEVGKCEIKIGSYEYDNYLLGIPKQKTSGFSFMTERGINLNVLNIKIKNNMRNSVTVNNLFTGVWGRGEIDYDIDLAICTIENKTSGNMLMGFHNNAKQFSIIVKSENYKTNKDAGFKLTFGGDSMADIDFY